MKYILILIITLLTPFSLNASYYKGYKLYQKHCIECHDLAITYVKTIDTQERERYFLSDKLKLYTIHKSVVKNPEHIESVEYFKSDKYINNIKNYNDFFKHYAADTGNVPVCY